MQTRCPHCQTRFRVTTEQLKLRQGMVRCGACHEVFDALDSLSDESLAVVAPPTLEPPSIIPESQLLHDGTAAPQSVPECVQVESAIPVAAIEAAANEAIAPEHEIEIVIGPESLPEDEQASQPVSESEPEPEPESESESEHVFEPVPETLAEPFAQDQPEPVEAAATEAAAASEASEPSEISNSSEPPEAWQAVPAVKPARRWPWAIGSALLLLAAAAQLAYLFRVELAVVMPAMRPVLVAGCDLLGCDLPRPRKPDQIDFETSDLAPQGKGLQLTATLRNRAPFAQDYPNLELTLTDTNDEALVRRIFAPAEYLPAGQSPDSGFVAHGAVDIKLALATDDVPAVGYRLYFFYP